MKDKKYYTNMTDQEKYERLEQARNNSVSSRNQNIMKVDYNGQKYRVNASRLKVAVVTAFLVTALASSAIGIGINKMVDEVKSQNTINYALSEYDDIVVNHTHRTQDNTGYWYDPTDIAIDILNAENRDLAIYAVYKDIDYNRTQNMTDIFSEMDRVIDNNPDLYKDIPKYGGYENYLKSMGCVDKNGDISVEKYREKMDDIAEILGKDKKQETNNKTSK